MRDKDKETTGLDPTEKETEYSFIREKIKEKPFSKKRMLIGAIIALLFGALFGGAFTVVNVMLTPILKESMESADSFSIPADEDVTEEEPTGEEQTDEDSSDEENSAELDAEAYQRLQTQLYAIGRVANKSIVTVTAISSDTDIFDTDYENTDQASGVIIGISDKQVLILTQYSSISGAEEIQITFISGASSTAEIVNYDGNIGLAVVSVQTSDLSEGTQNSITAAKWGNSYNVSQGDVVLAVGSPLGSVYSILNGTITSVNNEVSMADSIYTMFSTNMLGSTDGTGVLINLDGEVIGIVLMDYNNESDQNTLTAISVSELKSLIEKLSNGEDIAYLGAEISTVTSVLASEYDIPVGVYIKSVAEDSPALSAGLQAGDIIVEIDGESVTTVAEYMDYLAKQSVGDTITLTIERLSNGAYMQTTCDVTLSKCQ